MTDSAKKPSSRNASITTNPAAGEANATDKAQGETHSSPFREKQILEGYVVSGDNKSQTVNVRVGERVVHNVHWSVGVILGLAGIKTNSIPTRGTRVAFVFGDPSFVVGTLPADPGDDSSGNNKELSQTHPEGRGRLDLIDGIDAEGVNTHATVANDMFEGELEIGNQMGVALQLLHGMACLQAGDRAKVETFISRDMVRIISDYFSHITAFGDMQIYDDGRLNVKFDGTSYPHEAWSLMSAEASKADVSSFQVAPEEDLTKTGRWRFSQYIGFLGDFVTQFVTEPAATASSIAEGAFRPGKSKIQQMSDGTILMQSVADIVLERVCRVQVPIEAKRWDDPEGVKKEAFEKLNNSFLKIWKYGTNNKDIHHCAYQLREYSRWLSCYHGFARFHQMAAAGEEWIIPPETEENTKPKWTNQEEDVVEANPESVYLDAYACVRIMRDGSIVLWDSYGNGLTLGKSGIQISSVEVLELDSAGDIRLTAGQDIILKARRNVEISAIAGGLILKACTWWKALCEKGVLWLKGDGSDPAVDNDTSNPRGSDADHPDVEQLEYGVLIESSKGRLGLRSERTLHLAAEGVPDSKSDQADVTGSVIIESRFQDVRMYGLRNAILKSAGANTGVIGLEAVRSIVADAPKFLSSAYIFDISQQAGSERSVTIKGGRLSANQVAANFVGATTRLAGPERGPQPDGPPPPGCCLPPHFNHVDTVDEFDAPQFAAEGDLEPRTDYENNSSRNPLEYKSMFSGDEPEWQYPAAADYKWPNESADNYPRQEPLAQQRTSFDTVLKDRTNEWQWGTYDKLENAPRTNVNNRPYPGNSVQEMYHPTTAGDNLHEPLDGAYKDQNNQTPMQARRPKRQYRKRNVE